MTTTAPDHTAETADLDAALDSAVRRRTGRRLLQACLVPLCGLIVVGLVAWLTASGGGTSAAPVARPGRDHRSRTATPPGSTTAAPSTTTTVPVPTVSFDPNSVAVLVDGTHPLSPGYVPPDLIDPLVHFTFSGQNEKRMMRREAASALVNLFAAASRVGMPLAGVSAYRSEARQRDLYGSYSHRDGPEAASQYSAAPGTSEHQTGLAVDVSGADGHCQASPCFGATPAARWLAANAATFGFIIRYPPGKEAITGYQYEPWHIRYVGVALAQAMAASGLTMEEYALAHPPA
jgi:D-alanyl-D-alanine carboxypeptidase